jgi:hypothetical protein
MRTVDFLISAKNSETRRQKIDWLFHYFKDKNITHTNNRLIEWVGYTDEQIDSEIEDYLTIERKGL